MLPFSPLVTMTLFLFDIVLGKTDLVLNKFSGIIIIILFMYSIDKLISIILKSFKKDTSFKSILFLFKNTL